MAAALTISINKAKKDTPIGIDMDEKDGIVTISSVDPQSISKGKLFTGDRIVSINKENIFSLLDATQIIKGTKSALTFVIERQKDEKSMASKKSVATKTITTKTQSGNASPIIKTATMKSTSTVKTVTALPPPAQAPVTKAIIAKKGSEVSLKVVTVKEDKPIVYTYDMDPQWQAAKK